MYKLSGNQDILFLAEYSEFLLNSYLFSSKNLNFGSVAEIQWPVLSYPICAPRPISLKNSICLKEIQFKIAYKLKENVNIKFV